MVRGWVKKKSLYLSYLNYLNQNLQREKYICAVKSSRKYMLNLNILISLRKDMIVSVGVRKNKFKNIQFSCYILLNCLRFYKNIYIIFKILQNL